MGIGQKIKDALQGDHHDEHREGAYDDTKPPGSFPSESETTGKHGDGRTYAPPQGTAVGSGNDPSALHHSQPGGGRLHKGDDPRAFGTTAEPSQKHHGQRYPEEQAYGHGHGHHDSGVDVDQSRYGHREGLEGRKGMGSATKEPYWGNIEGERQGHSTGHHSGTGTTTAGAGGLGSHGTSGLAHYGQQGHTHMSHPTGRDDLPPPRGEAVGGGVYNTVTGAGSQQDTSTRAGHGHGYAGDTSVGQHGTMPGTGGLTGGDSGFTGKRDTHGVAPTSRNDNTSHGLAGAGAGLAAGGAASELSHRHHEQDMAEYQSNPTGRGTDGGVAPGMPRGSMLDDHSTDTSRGHHQGLHSTTQPANTMGDPVGVRSNEPIARKEVPGEHSLGSSGVSGTHGGPIGGSTGAGREHLGPGHQGSKVMHTCEHCGRDNDISHYFNKDAVYRIGSQGT